VIPNEAQVIAIIPSDKYTFQASKSLMFCYQQNYLLYRGYSGKPEVKRSLGRQRRRWIDTIKMDLLWLGLSVVDWIGLAHDRYRWRAFVNAVMNHRVP
jgi:hypothetical protein